MPFDINTIMRFKQYITEQPEKEKIYGAIVGIYNKCQPFLNEWAISFKSTALFLYRGTSGKPLIYTGNIRKDRRPSSSNMVFHMVANNALNDKLGIKYRSNAIFTTGDSAIADYYGNSTYMIFPIGKYSYAWNPNIRDLYIHSDIEPYSDRFDKIIDGYKDTDLRSAIISGNEIMVSGKSYFAVDNVFYDTFFKWYSTFGKDKPSREKFESIL